MCDTFGLIKKDRCLFSKNSDRSANEAQVIQFIERKKHTSKKVKVTYVDVEQVKETYAILISRPTWMWGAEIGVNEFGVCIGNEAIFTKRNKKDKSLIGMDLLRLALERSKTAEDAIEVIKDLLKKYNQGGNCAYDHDFFYDNSFLIMDFESMYVLETFGDRCEYKKFDSEACISNEYILEHDFKRDGLVTFFSGARKRRQSNLDKIKDVDSVLDCYKLLRSHNTKNYKSGSVNSVCMHEGGLIGDHTTSSMVIELNKKSKSIEVYFTGTSTPCMSLFKYYKFGDIPKYPICTDDLDSSYFLKREKLFREKLCYILNDKKRDTLEKRIYDEKINLEGSMMLEEEFYHHATYKKVSVCPYSKMHWKKKNKVLGSK